MARITYQTRLEPLRAGPLADNDRRFAQSLLDFYTRKKRLTPGRARCVAQLEERYSPEVLAGRQDACAPVLARLDAVLGEATIPDWEKHFLGSLRDQAQIRDLSPRQLEILEKGESRYTAEAKAESASWSVDYTVQCSGTGPERIASKQERALIAARYYKKAGYFQQLADKIIDDPNFVPSEKQYRKMVENKYAQKVLNAHLSPPKYPVGSFVALRATASAGNYYSLRRSIGTTPCVVIKANSSPVTSAARGSKK